MNIYELSKLIEKTFQENSLTNTITFLRGSEIDTNKVTIYPLINIEHLRYTPGESVNTYEMEIHILQQRDDMPIMNPDNKRFGDNKIDNWNETSLIADKFILDMKRNPEIEASPSQVEFISKAYTSLLDGVTFGLVVEVDNETDC